ncbi:MAG: DUF6261 family protein [Verrucomicrobiales bacterium]|jgi:hypothetical protein|nr:DUF6261 family protein [Verrucomicrobiales bacterium]
MLKAKLTLLVSFPRLRNEMHFEFNHRLFSYIAEHGGATGFNVGEPFKPAHAAYLEEDAALQHIRKSALTPQIEDQHALRKLAFSSLRTAVLSALQKPGAESYHNKALAVKTALDAYRSPHGRYLSYNEWSGLIHNLVEDLSVPVILGYLVDLKIDDRLATLRDENERFDKLYDERIVAEGGQAHYQLPAIRARLDEAGWNLANAIAYGADRETYKGKYVAFIEFYNELVAKFQQYIDRHHKRKGKDGGAAADAGETPAGVVPPVGAPPAGDL